jgi:hypothetical protein
MNLIYSILKTNPKQKEITMTEQRCPTCNHIIHLSNDKADKCRNNGRLGGRPKKQVIIKLKRGKQERVFQGEILDVAKILYKCGVLKSSNYKAMRSVWHIKKALIEGCSIEVIK